MAPVWGWILAYLLGFVLFQAFLYWYLQRDGARFESVPSGYRDADAGTAPMADPRRDQATHGDTIECRHCGVINESDSAYTYCRECVREMV